MDQNSQNVQNDILNALKNLQMLFTKFNGVNDQLENPIKDTGIYKSDDLLFETIENNLHQKKETTQILKTNEKNAPNIQKIKKEYRKIPKESKDIYSCINSNGERVGIFYGLKPMEVAKKVANRMYRENEVDIFELKIYNRMTDRLYSYKAQVIQCEKIKKIKGIKIPITHYIKLVRI